LSSSSDLRKQFAGQNRATVSMQLKNNDAVHVRKSTRPEPRQQKFYSALGISLHPGTTIKKTNKSSAITEFLKI
jgi:hypothetical protein